MGTTVYLRLKQRIKVSPNTPITLGDISQIVINDEHIYKRLLSSKIYQIKPSDKNLVVIDIMKVIDFIHSMYPTLDIQTVGPSQTLLEVMLDKRKKTIPIIIVWILLFIGSALTIMNFHEDVSMQLVQQKIFYLITGVELKKPLILQIPYSFGLGIGMIIFFNHIFKKRLNEEPSPLEVEMFKYQQDLDQYFVLNGEKESRNNIDRN